MDKKYDKYYQTENLFGKPYPELLSFFSNYPTKGKLLDLGCGQGRDAIPLARLGFEVTGIDSSRVGIEQMNKKAIEEALTLKGMVEDIYEYDQFALYDFILLDSMFHFSKKDKAKETAFINRILIHSKPETIIVICIQDSTKKISILNEIINAQEGIKQIREQSFLYEYEEKETGHSSKTKYKMIVLTK